MACKDTTPWTITEHPYTVNRLRATSGDCTDQSTGEWVPGTMDRLEICGAIGRGLAKGSKSTVAEDLERIAGAQFKTGDQYLMCHTDCDVALNDLLEAYDDAAGTTKTYWRVLMKLKTLTTMTTMMGYGQDYWLLRMEKR